MLCGGNQVDTDRVLIAVMRLSPLPHLSESWRMLIADVEPDYGVRRNFRSGYGVGPHDATKLGARRVDRIRQDVEGIKASSVHQLGGTYVGLTDHIRHY